jgi:hypothetical protein
LRAECLDTTPNGAQQAVDLGNVRTDGETFLLQQLRDPIA